MRGACLFVCATSFSAFNITFEVNHYCILGFEIRCNAVFFGANKRSRLFLLLSCLLFLFDYENGGDIVSENLELPPTHTASQPKRLYSSSNYL
jgi:hypothetical protein